MYGAGEKDLTFPPVVRPMAGVSFDPIADSYDATRRLPEPVMAGALDVLAEVLGTDGLVLEAGVGTGRFAIPLRARRVRIVGVDIAPRMLASARSKGGGDLFLASATHLPFLDGAFRASMAIHLLHLVAEWRAVLRELARVTRGTFVTLFETITTRSVGGEETQAYGDAVAYPMPRYQELASARGYEYVHPGVRPPDLAVRVPPDFRRSVGTHRVDVTGAELVEPIADKTHSSQWDVPDAVHAEIMAQLRREVGRLRFERTWDVEVVAWTPEQLRRF